MVSRVKKTNPLPNENEVAAEYSAITAMFKVAAKILAIRLFLFLSLVGAFALAVIATENQNLQSSWVLIIYAGVTILPLTILEFAGKKINGG